MRALQLHYTSCRRGRSGSAGFQVRALSPGITPEEQREIERRGVYRPPRDVPQDAVVEGNQRDYPVALRFYTLESGRMALTRSCYSGRDYSGRLGNYFAHTLVFEDGSAPPLWPIDYYEWPRWRSRLEPAEDTEDQPPSLAVVDLGEVEPAESFQLEEISEFLREEPGREQLLARMGRAVLLGLEDARTLVIRDSTINNPYWIASIQKLFPPTHAATLSYSSYQEDPRDCAAVNATAGETGFTFSEAERRYQFYMFDFSTGSHSEVPDAGDYPAIAAHWLARDPAELERFFEFMHFFEHRRIEPQLLSALHLFELFRQRDQHLEGDALAAMIRFATRWTGSEGRVELAAIVSGAVERIGGLRRIEDYEGVIRFLAEGAAGTGQQRHRKVTFTVWMRLLDDQVIGQDQGLGQAQTCERLIESHLPAYVEEWARRLLDAERWSRWRDRLPLLAPEILVFLLRLSWRALDAVGRRPAWEQPEVADLVRALCARPAELDRLASMALEAVPAEAEALAAVSRLAASGSGADQDPQPNRIIVGRVLGRILARVPPPVASTARQLLDDVEGRELLFGEWLEILDTAEDPQVAFGHYQQTVVGAVPGYRQHFESRIALALLDKLPSADAEALAVAWLGAPQASQLADDLAHRCLQLANRAVALDAGDHDSERIARLVAETAAQRKFELSPDRSALRLAMGRVDAAKTMDDLELKAIEKALEGIDGTDYRDFLAIFLLPALELTGAENSHKKVLQALVRKEHPAVFEKAYRDYFRVPRKSRWSHSLYGALRLWLWFEPVKAADRPLARFQRGALRELGRVLSRLPTKRYEGLQRKIQPRKDLVKKRWESLKKAVENRRRGPLAKLKGFLFRRSRKERGGG